MLEDWRKLVDEIDDELVKELEERFSLVRKIGDEKQKIGKNIYDRSREEIVLKKVREKAASAENAAFLEAVFSAIMETSRKIQAGARPKRVGFQGTTGAFQEEALRAYFGRFVEAVPKAQFEDVVSDVATGDLDYGVLPIENTSTGAITAVYDILNKYNVHIVGEKLMKIDHHLIGIPGAKVEEIEEVYSHTQGFKQCRNFLDGRGWKEIPYHNTAMSVEYVAKCGDKTKAAIGSARAAESFGLEIIKKRINTNVNNATRFIVISSKPEIPEDADKTSIMVTIPHVCGSLYHVIGCFQNNGVNMLKIESRPIEGRTFEYSFFIDLEGCVKLPKLRDTIEELRGYATTIRVLGSYKSDNIITSPY